MSRVLWAMAALVVSSAPVPAFAGMVTEDGRLLLRLNDRATVHIDGDRFGVAEDAQLAGDGPPYARDRIQVSFQQTGSGYILTVANGYGQPLDYEAEIFLKDGRHGPTSICTVSAGQFNTESWRDDLIGIALSKPRLVSEKDMACD